MAQNNLDKQVQHLLKKGVALPRHPLRAKEAAQDIRRMVNTPNDLRDTVRDITTGRKTNEDALAEIKRNNEIVREMGRGRRNKTRHMEGASRVRYSNFPQTGGTFMDDVSLALPRFYDPLEFWDVTGLPWNMADEGHRHKLHKWLRLYYATHYLVPILIDIFTRFPLVGMHVEDSDPALVKFYEELFLDKLDYPNFFVSMGREYWLVGESFALGSFDEDLGVWEHEELLNPEDVVIKNFPLLDSSQMYIVPPNYLTDLARKKSPAREYKMLEMQYAELIPYLLKNEHIPISNVLLRQVANKLTDWDDHGTPILLRGLRTLMHEEKLLASQDAIAERLYSPFILAKVGIMDLGDGQPPWIPEPAELDMVRDDIDLALASDFRLMVHHFGIDIENVFGREQMPRLGDDFDRIERRLMMVFGVNPTLLSAGAATQPYASSALQAEFLNQMLKTYQGYIKKHFYERAAIVAEAQEHFDYETRGQTKIPLYEEVVVYDEDGKKHIESRPKLRIPDLKMEVLDMRDEATERQFMQALRAQGVPISDDRLMVGVDFDINDEIHKYNEGLIKKTVAQQEGKFKVYNILRTRNLPIPPDLRAEVEGVLLPTNMQGPPAGAGGEMGPAAPPGGGLGAPPGQAPGGGPGGGQGGGGGRAVVMPPMPPGLGPGGIGNPMGGGGAPAATPQGPLGPGGGRVAPPVSMERRKGLPTASSVTKNKEDENLEIKHSDDKVSSAGLEEEQKEEALPEKIIRELPKTKLAAPKKYKIIDEEQRLATNDES